MEPVRRGRMTNGMDKSSAGSGWRWRREEELDLRMGSSLSLPALAGWREACAHPENPSS